MLGIYMVDTVFNMGTDDGLILPGDRLKTSYCVAFLILGPMLVL